MAQLERWTRPERSSWLQDRPHHHLKLPGGRNLHLGPRTLVVGIVNVTPDSFSDGGCYLDPQAAVQHGLHLQADGADLLDIGGESTRPGASPVDAAEQVRRIEPVIGTLAGRLDIPISVDTSSPEVARAALDAGASIINDVSMLRDGVGLAALAARREAPLILMHSRGRPATMNRLTRYPQGIIAGIQRELTAAVAQAVAAGLDPGEIILDPGIGFAKTAGQSLEILAGLPDLAHMGHGLMVGVSRKSFIGRILNRPVEQRRTGTVAAEAAALAAGAHLLRTHDVAACRQMADLLDAIRRPRSGEPPHGADTAGPLL
ncbi:MAG: dihydropteroate synthase [Acidobacteriota bacterium]